MKEVSAWLPQSTVCSATLRRSNLEKGRLDLVGVLGFFRVLLRYWKALVASRCTLVYLSLSPNKIGFLRDMFLIWSAKACRKRLVAHLRGSNFDNFYQSSSPLFKKLLRCTWSRIDRAIVQSPRLTVQLRAAAPDVGVSVLPNGLPPSPGGLKQSYETRGAVTILFVGYLTFTKGFYDLLRVVRTLNAREMRVRFRFAGERPPGDLRQLAEFLSPELRGGYLARCQEIAAETNQFIDSAGRYGGEYLGVISGAEKEEAFRTADIFALPSYAEGFSVALLEAMRTGLPIVTTPVGAAPDVLKDGVHGYLVPPGDLSALEEKLRKLIGDPQLREQMGRTNQREAAERYSIRSVSRQLAEILVEAASPPAASDRST